jgi:hypothetical protein
VPPVSAYDHLRPVEADYPEGVYRVVGTTTAGVTMLRVTDADGRRAATGDLVTVGAGDLEGFEPAENPDGNRPLGAAVASRLKMTYWSVRAFTGELAAHPVPTAAAGAVVAAGLAGDALVPVPDAGHGVAILVGSLGLAYVGSGRL